MPKLTKHARVTAKLDSAAEFVDVALTAAQKRELFENPGKIAFAIVQLQSTAYTGHAETEGKDPQVKLRIIHAEVARDEDEAASLGEAGRAMYRRRRMDGTLDEVGQGPQGVTAILSADFAGYPSEEEFQRHEEAKAARARELERAAKLR
ncbi:hypothetical protein V2S66_03135 [Streptomyces sp. V4-01]|uniref:Uncharacterized protein n=1 Tax=Actinacidiphila polyblastidii TaxID=3110430 RepID=A0ABU7P586_9ACTN|nr:hypothetical protein [Streptomyces sp. V4-01]